MSQDPTSTHHVTVRLAREFEFVAEFNGVPDAAPVMMDEPRPLGGGQAPNAVDLLSAAVGDCLAASLAFCLRKAHVEVRGLTADVTTHLVRNEKGRARISGIDVALQPELGRLDAPIGRCEELFEDFCTVTASVRRGIPVRVTMKEAPSLRES